jgi:hypothetical protein
MSSPIPQAVIDPASTPPAPRQQPDPDVWRGESEPSASQISKCAYPVKMRF